MIQPDKPVHALIDIDQLIYKTAFKQATEGHSFEEMTFNFRTGLYDLTTSILEICPTIKTMEHFITGSKNFRKRIKSEKKYKGNRKPKPLGLAILRQFAQTEISAVVDDFLEADDCTAMRHQLSATDGTHRTVLVDIDKDLDQIEGWRITPATYFGSEIVQPMALKFINGEQALFSFYQQILTGDGCDNVSGINGVGDTRSKTLLQGHTTERQLWAKVVEVYLTHKTHEGLSDSVKIARLMSRCNLLYLKRGKEDVFIPPLS